MTALQGKPGAFEEYVVQRVAQIDGDVVEYRRVMQSPDYQLLKDVTGTYKPETLSYRASPSQKVTGTTAELAKTPSYSVRGAALKGLLAPLVMIFAGVGVGAAVGGALSLAESARDRLFQDIQKIRNEVDRLLREKEDLAGFCP